MSEQSKETQYLTLDHTDITMGLSLVDQHKLNEFIAKSAEARQYRGLPPLSGVFISMDSPAFEEVFEILQKHQLAE